MLLEQLKEKAKDLNKEMSDNIKFLEDIEMEITNLKESRNCIEDENEKITIKIKKIINQIKMLEKEINFDIGEDKFIKHLQKANLFSYRDIDKYALLGISITDDKIKACDGIKGIVIKNETIPEKFKNTRIVLSTDKLNTGHLIDTKDKPFDIWGFIKECKKDITYIVNDITKENFDKKIEIGPVYREEDKEVIRLTHADMDIHVNNDILKLALSSMEKEQFAMHITTKYGPIIFENNEISLVFMPRRY